MNVLTVRELSASQRTEGSLGEVSRMQPQVLQFKMQDAASQSAFKEANAKENFHASRAASGASGGAASGASGSAGSSVYGGASGGEVSRVNSEGIRSKAQSAREAVPAVIKVISAGGGGANALNRMIEAGLSGVEFIAVNTDIQDLYNKSKAETKVQIGARVTGGRGAGGKPEKGENAAIEDQETICEVLRGADMVFITAGMGGGTGTGSAHVIAKIAKQLGALTVGVVTTPFEFEGRYKMKLAEDGIAKLRAEVDTLIIIRNQHLFKIIDNATSLNKAYLLADEILCQGVQ